MPLYGEIKDFYGDAPLHERDFERDFAEPVIPPFSER